VNFNRQELADRAASLAVQGVYVGTSSSIVLVSLLFAFFNMVGDPGGGSPQSRAEAWKWGWPWLLCAVISGVAGAALVRLAIKAWRSYARPLAEQTGCTESRDRVAVASGALLARDR
jgi:hypothetical protein